MDETNNLPQYWAGLDDHDELLTHLNNKIDDYYDDLDNIGLKDVWEKMTRAYYGGRTSSVAFNSPLFEGTRLQSLGKQGEKTGLKVNHFRNLIQHIHQLATSQKPTIRATSTNTDYKSQAQTILANGLVDYYTRDKRLGKYQIDAAEIALLYGEGFVHAPWSPSAGNLIAQGPMGEKIPEGDQVYELYTPTNVIRDAALKSDHLHDWMILKGQANRFTLAARYPQFAEEILSTKAYDPQDDDEPSFNLRAGNDPKNEDIINFYTFYHKKTEALPQGRIVIFVCDQIVFDGPLVYDRIPVGRIAAENLVDTIYGYSVGYDLLPIQEGLDELHTILMSNNKTFGIPNIWTSDTDKISVSMLSGGMRHIKSEQKPEAVNLTASAPETYKYLDMLERSAETISGVSSTVRGQPEASLKSGAALALIVSQSIQFISSFEESFNQLIEDIGTLTIENIRAFAKSQRVASIAGVSNRSYLKTYEAADLSQINRVVVERVSPLSKTIAGRVEIANNLLQQGLIPNPKQYITLLTTGQLDPLLEGTQQLLLNIRAENEEMREGNPVQALIIENHATHIQEHLSVIDNPDAKKDPALVQMVMEHIQQHLDLWRAADPGLLMITGQQPPPPPPMIGQPAPAQVQNPEQPVVQQAQESAPAGMPGLPEGSPLQSQQAYEKLGTKI